MGGVKSYALCFTYPNTAILSGENGNAKIKYNHHHMPATSVGPICIVTIPICKEIAFYIVKYNLN